MAQLLGQWQLLNLHLPMWTSTQETLHAIATSNVTALFIPAQAILRLSPCIPISRQRRTIDRPADILLEFDYGVMCDIPTFKWLWLSISHAICCMDIGGRLIDLLRRQPILIAPTKANHHHNTTVAVRIIKETTLHARTCENDSKTLVCQITRSFVCGISHRNLLFLLAWTCPCVRKSIESWPG